MNIREAAILVEKRLGVPASERLRVLSYCVQSAVYFSRKLAKDHRYIHYVLCNPDSVQLPIVSAGKNGFVLLDPIINTSPNIFKDLLYFGNIYLDGIKANWISVTQSQYVTSFTPSAPQIWLTGSKLNILDVEAGILTFQVPCLMNITALPPVIEDRIIDKAVELATEIKTVVRPDYAQDGEN